MRTALPDVTYIFAVSMRNQPATATFTCKQTAPASAEVLGENRAVAVNGGVFTDAFSPYAAHLYRLR